MVFELGIESKSLHTKFFFWIYNSRSDAPGLIAVLLINASLQNAADVSEASVRHCVANGVRWDIAIKGSPIFHAEG